MRRRVSPIDWTGVPASYVGKCSAVCRTAQDCEDLVRYFGSPDFCPYLPVLLMVPGAPSPTAIAGLGYATAAELRDDAVVTWHRQSAKFAKGEPIFDFDTLREKHGLMPRDQVDNATRDAMRRRVQEHKANPVSDPPRKPKRANPLSRTAFGYEGEGT